MSLHDENIVINIDVDENSNNYNNTDNDENELETILNEINNIYYSEIENYNENTWFSNSDLIAKSIDYDTNYNVKQLLTICDYYGLLKEVKINKFKKPELILFLLDFEENMENSLIVYKRKQLWYFIEELKNDKFMKKYVLW
jgi:hypothetical protein